MLFPSPGDLPEPGIELRSPAIQADSLLPEPPGKPSLLCRRIILKKKKNEEKSGKIGRKDKKIRRSEQEVKYLPSQRSKLETTTTRIM